MQPFIKASEGFALFKWLLASVKSPILTREHPNKPSNSVACSGNNEMPSAAEAAECEKEFTE
jgi:hypothetical protein